MAKKDLIIGVFSNYKYDDVKPWVKSVRECGFKGDAVLIGIDIDDETSDEIERNGVIVIRARKNTNMMIHMERFFHIHDFLKHNDYNYVVSTDVRDVIFQKDPTEWLYENLEFGGIVSSTEAIKIKDEKWNRDNIIKNFGEYYYDEIKEQEVQCVGILAGDAKDMKDLCFYLFQMSLNRPDWVADQAAYNVIVHNGPWKERIKFAKLENAWAVNAHVTNYEDLKHVFEPYLMEERPVFENGIVKVKKSMKEFYIIHQYDRVREWKKFYEEKYGVKINSQYTPDDKIIVINTGV